jgi:hypothetical protein
VAITLRRELFRPKRFDDDSSRIAVNRQFFNRHVLHHRTMPECDG